MCGIFGSVSDGCVEKTLQALHFLEYRGYDSAGISVNDGTLHVVKRAGRVASLEQALPPNFCGFNAIGHTRWATHGAVCDVNAHPFLSADRSFAVCHNGILENHADLHRKIAEKGIEFSSSTDSEAIAHLLQLCYKSRMTDCLLETAKMLNGSFAVLVQKAHDGNLYALKNKSPLVVGVGEGEVYLCSDVRCLSKWAQRVAVVPDGTVVCASPGKVSFFGFDGKPKRVDFFAVEQVAEMAETGGDMMIREILEIPQCVRRSKQKYFESGGIGLGAKMLKKLSRIYLLGCGTAYNSGLEIAAVARTFLGVDLLPVVASEFVYDNFPVDGNTLAFCISQSGETADTIRAAEKVVARGGYAYAVTNTDVSSLCFVCNSVKNVQAGGEYAVASTKAYNCQLVTLLLLVADIAFLRGEISADFRTSLCDGLDRLPLAIDEVLQKRQQIADIAHSVKDSSAVFFVGRTADFPTATEASLKLKEISYLHSEAYPSGELKHGTLALMERGVTVVVISTFDALVEKNNSTSQEIVARGADVITLSPYKGEGVCITLPVVNRLLYGIVAVVPLQLLAYYVAKDLGRDVDKPRNLAKSVTVE